MATFLLAVSKDCDTMLLSSIKSSSFELELTCSILGLSSITRKTNNPSIINDILKHTISAVQHSNSNNDTDFRRDFLLLVLLGIIQSIPVAKSVHLSPENMFDLWVSLSKRLDIHNSARLYCCIGNRLSCLFKTSHDTRDHRVVHQKIIDMSPDVFAEQCLYATEKLASLSQGDSTQQADFLSAVLTYDCSRFICLARTLSEVTHNGKLSHLWDNGQLDILASTFLLESQKQMDNNSFAVDPIYKKALEIIGERMTALLEQVCFILSRQIPIFVMLFFDHHHILIRIIPIAFRCRRNCTYYLCYAALE
jgi:hypothetical protein